MLLRFQYFMSNILINIRISSFFLKKKKDSKTCVIWSDLIYIYEFDNAVTFKHQSVLLFWYLDNFLVKDQTGLPL